MEKRNYFTRCYDFIKVMEVIRSCTTKKHIETAVKMADLFANKYPKDEDKISLINQLIQTFSYECR
jgi:hypothetical protein